MDGEREIGRGFSPVLGYDMIVPNLAVKKIPEAILARYEWERSRTCSRPFTPGLLKEPEAET